MGRWKTGLAITGMLVGALGMAMLRPGFRALIFSAGETAETRGWALAQDLGCTTCHGPMGIGGLANPGAQKIPSLDDFAFMMAVNNETELREWILDGAPQRLRDKPGFEKTKAKRAVVMPAYRGKISDDELEDLIAWYNVIACTVYPKDAEAVKGYKAAKKNGCFSCHGPGGRLDITNSGSLVGRIPAWHGGDYEELVANEAELHEWILDGVCKRLEENTMARLFMDDQVMTMPAYRGKISDEEVAAIVAYIHWLRDPSQPGHTPDFTGEEEEGFGFGFGDEY